MLSAQCKLSQIDIHEVGVTIQLVGAIWAGNGKVFMAQLPDEKIYGRLLQLDMDAAEWQTILNQSDVVDVRGPGKAILRKSQRLVDQVIAWEVYHRDGYVCRYCGRRAPLTVDHVILWEQGGATIADNLVSSCKRCNRTRGSMEYGAWLASDIYADLSEEISAAAREKNIELLSNLEYLRAIKAKPRSR